MQIDWRSLFVIDAPFLELVLGGTFMYFALLLAMRLLVRRHIGLLT